MVVALDVAPKVKSDVGADVEPNTENDEVDVGALSAVVAEGTLPNVGTAPKAGVGVVPLVEITGGANGFGGLLAPKANGVLLDVVVVVLADGKLKPDDDDDEPLPNRGADDDVVVVVVVVDGVTDVDTRGKLLGNGKPLVAEAGSVSEALVVSGGAVTFELKPNRLGVVVVVVVDDGGAKDKVEAPPPKENSGALSEDTVVELVAADVVVVASGVLPNDPNVIVVGILIGDVVAVVDGVVKNEGAADVVVTVVLVVLVDEFVAVAEPNDGKLADVLGLSWNRLTGVFVMVLSEDVALVPNRGVAVAGNPILVVTGGLITVFSFVVVGVVDDAPNKGKASVAENGVVDVASGGMEKVLSLPMPIVGADVVIGAISFGIVD